MDDFPGLTTKELKELANNPNSKAKDRVASIISAFKPLDPSKKLRLSTNT